MRTTHLLFLRIVFLLAGCLPPLFLHLNAQSALEQTACRRYADSLRAERKGDEALAWLSAEKARLERQGRQRSADYAAVLFVLGDHFMRAQLPEKALENLHAALVLVQEIAPGDLESQIVLWEALGACRADADPLAAIACYEQALALRLAVSGDRSRSAAKGYYELAILHIGIDFEKATDYCQKAIRCLRNAGLTREADYGGYHQVLGLIYQEEGNFPEALKWYRQAVDTLRTYLGDHKDTGVCLSTLGETYAEMGQTDKALECQQAAVAMLERVDSAGGRYLREAYYQLGVTCNLAGQPENALFYLRRAQYFGAKPGAIIPAGVRLSIRLSDTYCLLGDYAHALACADTALAGLKDAPGQRGRFYYWHALLTKAGALAIRYQQEQNPPALLDAAALLAEAGAQMSLLIGGLETERSKLAVYREYLKEFDRSIAIYTRLAESTGDPAWLYKTLEFSETGKGLLQYLQILDYKNRRRVAAPGELVTAEKNLKNRITDLKNRLFETTTPGWSVQADSLDEQLFALNRQYEQLQDSIRSVDPGYFIRAAALPAVCIDSIQAGLNAGEGLLEFFAGDTAVLAFLLLPDTIIYRKIGPKIPLEEDVNLLRASIVRYFVSPEKDATLYLRSAADYAESAYRLYRTLLAPFGDLLPGRLTIVPDGVLAYLPFEALLVEKPERADRFHLHHYLARDFTLRYACSATLLREMESLPPEPHPSGRLLALAPFFDNTTPWRDSLLALRNRSGQPNLAPLPFSGEEVYKIAALCGGEVLAGADATKYNFIRNAGRYTVLHLATHARANTLTGDYSYLVFAPDSTRPNSAWMYVSEIYGLQLNAELVTLSACETGLGPLQRGEGILSIARAFAAAGARSMVQSQWTVSDAQTRRLMELFYQNLRKGQPKDLALRQARQEYLAQFRGEDAHPYFWAGFLLAGANRPLIFF